MQHDNRTCSYNTFRTTDEFIYSDQRVTKISKDDLTFLEDDLVFSDIF